LSKQLQISEDLSLPIDAATQTFAFIARKGAGKTYAAGKLTELLMDAGVQCVILDTVGNWYGLRLAADGKGPGFDIPVLGGLRGDVPLEATGGELVADLVVDTGRSVVIDLSQFSLADRKKFATAFAIQLWARKKAQRDPSPVHLVIEESQLIIPENTKGDNARMVGIYEEIIRLGRNYGIGVSMISQRPQSVNKEVLNQTECLFVLQVNGAHERKALKEWVMHHGVDVNLVAELPGLDIGIAYVWSPQWLKILKKVKIAPKRTFDSSATPKVGSRRQVREPAPLDLTAFKERMAATIERAKENDPKELKRTIAQLKRDLSGKQAAAPVKIEEKRIPLITEEQTDLLLSIEGRLLAYQAKFEEVLAGWNEGKAGLQEAFRELRSVQQSIAAATRGMALPRSPLQSKQRAPVPAPAARPTHARTPETNGSALPKAEKAVLRVLAHFPEGKTRREIGVVSGYKHSGGGFNNALAALRSKGYIDGRDPLRITEAGIEAVSPIEPLPAGQELYQYWMAHPDFGRAEREILRVLYELGNSQSMTKDEIAAQTISDRGIPYEANGGGFNNAISKLRAYELIEGSGQIRASEKFFE
jgi:hypothetical protein